MVTRGFLESSERSLSLSPMASAALVPSRAEVLSLFRSLLRTAGKFSDYNVREYAKRRTIDGFRESQTLSEPFSISSAFADGMNQLEVANRQAVAYSLYAPKVKNMMEIRSG
ncbi:LYR motif-containing protein 4 [Cocos nucifera]|uniref:LYR motif-containing protein 4 n=1 Tax=Cocos nucifera TaxID=13894 RepID=A0A8K0IDD9_COCNU|nr:LYR motif-containing protein 4 [Cocos nucifera]